MTVQPDPNGDATITDIRYYGHDQTVIVRLDDGPVLEVRTWPRPDLSSGVRVTVDVRGPVLALPSDDTATNQQPESALDGAYS
jgi:iron(III) transport system ATP-binding protein